MYKFGKSILAILLIAGALQSKTTFAQNTSPILDHQVIHKFGELLSFEAVLAPDLDVEKVEVFFNSQGSANTQVESVEIREQNYVSLFYSLEEENPLRAFAPVRYRFVVTQTDGEKLESEDFEFFYEDNRYRWEVLEEGPFRVHWYAGETDFGQDVLDVAQLGADTLQDTLDLPIPQELDIYVYSRASDLRQALDLSGKPWLAGHANPDLGIVLVSVIPGPEQSLEMEREVPHEVAHAMLYEKVGDNYANIPAWLNEGIASLAELYPNPDYQQTLVDAADSGELVPLADLCQDFPDDTLSAGLAYAQSNSFVRYISRTYGPAGLDRLVDAYSNGASCEEGTNIALGQPLSAIERTWSSSAINANPGLGAFGQLLPWLIIAVVPIGLSLGFTALRARQKEA
ncbi:MAG: hypothetical protein DWQ07_03530 [Chloroflexi bacterium]|nr:MAG: hypothetical protein DWQ07_03530 [Chloroflexota bacterium]MBL1193427.1 hypothetical protein [Chloroflexota bacterium]NOH10719.1 hypothetical protein [Chloroflexota bacterium]